MQRASLEVTAGSVLLVEERHQAGIGRLSQRRLKLRGSLKCAFEHSRVFGQSNAQTPRGFRYITVEPRFTGNPPSILSRTPPCAVCVDATAVGGKADIAI
jgi:hypothetical protein